MTTQDVSLYGGLCALATFSRSELKSKVISSVSFKELLEMHPDVLVLCFLTENHLSVVLDQKLYP